MSGKAIIFIVVGTIIVASVTLHSIEAASMRVVSNFSGYALQQSAQNIAQSAVNMGLHRLAQDTSWRSGLSVSMFSGTGTVDLTNTTYMGVPVVAVRGIGILSCDTLIMAFHPSRQVCDTSIAYVRINHVRLPADPISTVMTPGTITIAGNFVIDGRDHDSTGTTVVGNGVWGVFTTSTNYSQNGSSQIGGYNSFRNQSYAPQRNPADSVVVRTSQVYPGGAYPTTPDQVLGGAAYGYTDGTLKEIAQSGAQTATGFCQYVTDPTQLVYPLSGVTYVELPPGGIWTPSGPGSGILIVHNSTTDAQITGATGNFNGLIIADILNHLQSTTVGAVVALSPNPPAGNPHIGTGNGTILYSSQSVHNAERALFLTKTSVMAWRE